MPFPSVSNPGLPPVADLHFCNHLLPGCLVQHVKDVMRAGKRAAPSFLGTHTPSQTLHRLRLLPDANL
jgi:hypothetical protein